MPELKRQDVELYYELSGHGPPVLFIQGVGVVGEGWRPQVNALQHRFQTLLFDNRGIGKSAACRGPITIEAMADDARALMDAVGWPSAHVVGHSMGGVIAQQLALAAPDRVRSLALLCTFARGKDAAKPTPRVIWLSLRARVGTRRMRRRAFLDMLYPPGSLQGEDTDALAERMEALVGRDLAEQPAILMQQLGALSRHNAFSRLHELAGIPAYILSAAFDPIALPRFGRQLAAAIPGALFELMHEASHGVTIHRAEEVNRRLIQFLEVAASRQSAGKP